MMKLKINNTYRELKERWKAELNLFWKRILNFSLVLGAAALGVVTADQIWNLQALGVEPMIFTVCGYILTACGAFGLAAKLTK